MKPPEEDTDMVWLIRAAVILAFLAFGGLGEAHVAVKKELTLEGARQVIVAATTEARRDSAGGTIAIVDEGGNLVALERLDGTFAASASISIGRPAPRPSSRSRPRRSRTSSRAAAPP